MIFRLIKTWLGLLKKCYQLEGLTFYARMLLCQKLEEENCSVRLVGSPSCIEISRSSKDLRLNRPSKGNFFNQSGELCWR